MHSSKSHSSFCQVHQAWKLDNNCMEYQYWTIQTTAFFLDSGDKDKGGAQTTDIGLEIVKNFKIWL